MSSEMQPLKQDRAFQGVELRADASGGELKAVPSWEIVTLGRV